MASPFDVLPGVVNRLALGGSAERAHRHSNLETSLEIYGLEPDVTRRVVPRTAEAVKCS